MSKLDKLPVKNEVIHQLAVGEPQTIIARQAGVNQSTISRFANENENIRLIEKEREKLVKIIPDAVENVKSLVKEMPTIPKDDIKRRELSYRASKDVLKATNIFPSPQYAHNIYNDNRNQMAIELCIMKLFADNFQEKLEKLKHIDINQGLEQIDQSKNINIEPEIMKLFSNDFNKKIETFEDIEMNEPDNDIVIYEEDLNMG